MPTPTYDLLASNVLSSSASSVTFSSIPATYRDLVLVCSPITSSTTNIRLRLNSSSTGYSFVIAIGDGRSAISESGTGTEINMSPYAQTTTSADSNQIANIMDYSATDKHKSVLVRSNRAGGASEMQAHRWASTTAVSSLELFPGGGTFSAGSTFYLYGIVS